MKANLYQCGFYFGEEGAGGIIFDLGGNIVSSYSWGLGIKTNNEFEWLALYFGMKLTMQLNIAKITVLGDSKQVIFKMNNGNNKGVIKIKRIYEHIRQVTTNAQVSYLYILRGNNSKADKSATQGAKLNIGSTKVKGSLINFVHVP